MPRTPALLACILLAALTTSPLLATWNEGVSAFSSGRYDDAAAVFETFAARSPQAPEGHFMLGLCRLQQKRTAEALASLGKAVELGEGEARFSLALAQTQLRAREGNDALSTLAALDPATVSGKERANFNQLLAKAATAGNRNAEARAALDKAVDADPASKGLWVALANVNKRLDRPEERFTALAKAFEIDPEDAETGRLATKAATVIAQDEEDDAGRRREWYRKASEVGGRLVAAFPTPEHLMLAGSAHLGAQQHADAVASFEKALAGGADDLKLRYELGQSTLALGRHEESLRHLEKALERSPSPDLAAGIHAARGLAYRGLEQFDRAAEAYRSAGDMKTASEMAGYAENRRDWAAAKADCERQRIKIENMRKDPGLLEGTPEWDELEQQMSKILAGCAPYLHEEVS